jgi:4-amino-4-deoxy-L-arabinose transferase-like glycosyltransferase
MSAPARGPSSLRRVKPSSLPGLRLWSLLRRVPREGWLCAFVACLNAACWSFITPPFQVPDEPDHYAYVEQLALTGELPSLEASGNYPADEALALRDLGTFRVRLQPENPAVFSRAEEQRLEQDFALEQSTPVRATGSGGVATSEPPLYYALELIPYELGAGGTVLDRIQLMRLLSAVLAGLTALFVFLFIREVLPGERWAWTVGGLAIALTPLLGFMSGGVTPEAMLYSVSAATFLCLARTFRRGLTPGRAATIAIVVAIGLLTKLNFVGFLPGIALGMVVLVRRLQGRSRAIVYRALGVALLTIAGLAVATVASGAMSHTQIGSPGASFHNVVGHGSLLGRVNYVWQFFLPRLPGTANDFPGIFTTRQIWFDGLVGLYGWLDTTFPSWVYDVALIPAAALVLLLIAGLVANRDALRRRSSELLTYALMASGLLILIGSASYVGFPEIGGAYAESRYLLPLLPLMGVALALAARGAGRRWGPTVGALMLMLFLAHDILSQLQVIARYYG